MIGWDDGSERWMRGESREEGVERSRMDGA